MSVSPQDLSATGESEPERGDVVRAENCSFSAPAEGSCKEVTGQEDHSQHSKKVEVKLVKKMGKGDDEPRKVPTSRSRRLSRLDSIITQPCVANPFFNNLNLSMAQKFKVMTNVGTILFHSIKKFYTVTRYPLRLGLFS